MTSAVKTVNLSDGQGIDEVDANNAQKFLQAQLFDLVFRAKMREVETGTPSGSTTPRCYGWGAGGAIKASVTALTSTNRPGVIATLPAPDTAPTGADPQALLYLLGDGELVTLHDAAHATLDRWDIVCVKLEQLLDGSASRDFEDASTRAPTSTSTNTTRTVTLTKQVVKGTNAAAGTAVEPATPVGFTKYAAVFIPATFASTFSAATHFRDHRVPLGQYDVAFVLPIAGYLDGWAPSSAHVNGGILAAAGGNIARIYIPAAPRGGRLMRLTVRAKITDGGGTGVMRLLRADMDTGAGGGTIIDLGHTSGAFHEFDVITSGVVQDQTLTAAPLVGPVWGCGQAGGPDAADANCSVCLAFVSGAAADVVEFIRYEMAGP